LGRLRATPAMGEIFGGLALGEDSASVQPLLFPGLLPSNFTPIDPKSGRAHGIRRHIARILRPFAPVFRWDSREHPSGPMLVFGTCSGATIPLGASSCSSLHPLLGGWVCLIGANKCARNVWPRNFAGDFFHGRKVPVGARGQLQGAFSRGALGRFSGHGRSGKKRFKRHPVAMGMLENLEGPPPHAFVFPPGGWRRCEEPEHEVGLPQTSATRKSVDC